MLAVFQHNHMNGQKPRAYKLSDLYLLFLLVFIVPVITSCGGSGNIINPTGTTTKLAIINTSPDAGPVSAVINNIPLGATSAVTASRTYFRYSTTPAYYSVNYGTLTIQLRAYPTATLTSEVDTIISNKSYSIFLVGLRSIDSLATIFTVDTSSVPTQGRGKIRFINASPRTPALDLSANGTLAFTKIPYKKVSAYIEVPAGIYDFKITATGTPTSILTDLPRITVQDGKLYTLFTKGLVGRTDTAALSLNIITNDKVTN